MSHHLDRIVIAKCTIKNKVLKLNMRPDQFEHMLQMGLHKLQIRTQFNIVTVTILTAFGATYLPWSLWLTRYLSLAAWRLLKLFDNHGVRHATFDTDQRQTQKTEARDHFTVN